MSWIDHRNKIPPDWRSLPDSLLLKIFSYLNFSNIYHISLVCRRWYRVSQDEFLWRQFFYQDFRIKKKMLKAPGTYSWLYEYRRLVENVPVVECETLREHCDQVLHVSFSHNGKMFATTSKDGCIMVWSSAYPAQLLYCKDMKIYSWKYTQFSQFNSSDTLLLVSGVHFGNISTSGEIAIFNLENDFQLQCRALNKPYDIFGAWYNDEYFLSGELRWLGSMVSTNTLWLNKANQELQSEHEAILMRLFQFYNINASSVRTVMMANCVNANTSSVSPGSDNIPVESESEDPNKNRQSLSEEGDKYLIFSTGTKTYFPHVVGFKRINKFKIPTVIEVAPNALRERIAQQQEEKELRSRGLIPQVDWLNYESVKDKFDQPDFTLDLSGHIIGMALSPDHRFLYVNSRPWPKNFVFDKPLQPPVISEEIDIHVIDLMNCKEVGSLLRSHKAYTTSNDCFFIFLDVSPQYVASGAEDHHGYIWERHYEACLVKYPHKDVVNCIAFNPVDPEMLITVSDDHRIKIWRSRNTARELNINLKDVEFGTELREHHSINDDKELLARLQTWEEKRLKKE